MKNIVMIVFALVCLISIKAISKEDEIPKKVIEGTLSVQSSPDVYDLTQEWVNEFRILNPLVSGNVKKISNSSSSETQSNYEGLTVVSSNYKTNLPFGVESFIVGRQVIVPVISSQNSNLDEVLQKGITAEVMSQLLTNSVLQFNNKTVKMNYYAVDNTIINEKVEKFIKSKNSGLSEIKVENTGELIDKIKGDPNGFGFCMLVDVVEKGGQSFVDGLKLLPIDKNQNGKLDYMEQFYNTPNSFLRGVWIGKYPSELTENLFVLANNTNSSDAQKAFLSWIIVEGQKSLSKYGFHKLLSNEIASKLDKIQEHNFVIESVSEKHANLKAILLFVGFILFIGLLIDFAVFRHNRITSKKNVAYEHQVLFNEKTLVAPLGLLFDKSHTWAFMEKNGHVKIGMSDFIPSITGTLTSLVLKRVGEKIKKGEVLLSVIQQGKQLNIKAPVSGTIKITNEKLFQDASLINISPYNEGWIYAIEPTHWSREIQYLLMFDTFKIWLKSEHLRLKDFLAIIKSREDSMQPAMVLQEGGEIRKSVLKDFDPKIWEDFQQYFIDSL